MGEIIEGEEKGERRVLGWGEKIWVGEFRENERGGCLVGEGREGRKWG